MTQRFISQPSFAQMMDMIDIPGGERTSQSAAYPADVIANMKLFWGNILTVRESYNRMHQGYLSIIQSTKDYTPDYIAKKVEDFYAAMFNDQAAELLRAKNRLEETRGLIDMKTQLPLTDSNPAVHEMKLLNAREEVKLALDGVRDNDLVTTLVDLVKSSLTTEPAIAYYLVATPAYKRLLKDSIALLDYEQGELDALKRLMVPAELHGYLDAQPALKDMAKALGQAEAARGFAAMDYPELNITLDSF